MQPKCTELRTAKPLIGSSGQLPNGDGFQNHEDLGTGNIAGLTTLGYRDTTVVNPGVFGNNQPMTTSREFWYSPRLGINLLSTLDSPRTGKQVFTVTEISTASLIQNSFPFRTAIPS